jgi:hypothetical protein
MEGAGVQGGLRECVEEVCVVFTDLLRLFGGSGGAEERERPVEWDGDSPGFLKIHSLFND